jgi:hypothetical protein
MNIEKQPEEESKSSLNDEEREKNTNSNCEEFSSERYKLEIKNLPRNFGFGVFIASIYFYLQS